MLKAAERFDNLNWLLFTLIFIAKALKQMQVKLLILNWLQASVLLPITSTKV